VLPVTLTRKNRVAVAFYLSSDGGKTWRLRSVRRVEFSRPGPNNPFSWYVPTSIAGATMWWIAAGMGHPSIAVTTDAGNSWRAYPISTLPRATTWDLSATDSEHGWLMTTRLVTTRTRSYDESALYATADGGRSWLRLKLPSK
jgi:hypothetical protein